jgi:Zn-dependent oligopeptidase
MENPIKFTDQEMAEIRMLQQKFQEKVFEFGKFHLERASLFKAVKDLEERIEKADDDFKNLQSMEADLLDKLTKKYGIGQLNLENGTFVADSPPKT